MMKRSFFFHYNKPASKSAGRPKLSVHFRDTCYIVDKVVCHVGVESKNNKRQPHCVMKGKAFLVEVKEENGLSTASIL
jgi:hypothetical protein